MASPEEVKEVFAKYDENGDGKIQEEELVSVLTRLANMKTQDARKLFKAIDKDGSGAIDYKEFVDFLYKPAKKDLKAKAVVASGGYMTIERVFYNFCGTAPDLDNKGFIKLCKDCDLMNSGKLSLTDLDLMFTKVVPKGQRRIDYAGFQKLLAMIAEHLGSSVESVETTVRCSLGAGGPIAKGTTAEPVRFHDDKSTYTGAHRGRSQEVGTAKRDAGRSDTRTATGSPQPSAGASRCVASPSPDRAQLVTVSALEKVFKNYCGGSKDLDGKSFAKISKDCGLYGKSYSSTDADLIFAKACKRGQRRLSYTGFQEALALVAEKLLVDTGFVEDKIMSSGGVPELRGTQADGVRFHDDKSTYTGAHARDGRHS